MWDKEAFETEKAAVLGGPYSQAIIHNGLIYLSGQGPIDPQTDRIVHGTIEQEAEITMDNVRIILDEAGSSIEKLLQVRVFLLDIKEYGRFNDVYGRYFEKDPPARTCIQAGKLPFGVRVEMDAVGYI